MEYYSYKEWKQLGYIVKKGEHATKVDDDYENTYLFSKEQVRPIKKSNNFIDSADDRVWQEAVKYKYPKIKKILKDNFNIDVENESGQCKSLRTVIEELHNKMFGRIDEGRRKIIMDYMSIRKGMILYKPRTDFTVRYIVVDYDITNVYCIDLNDTNNIVRKVIKLSYDECNKEFNIE